LATKADEDYVSWLVTPLDQGGGGFHKAKILSEGVVAAIRPLLYHWTMNVCMTGDKFSLYDRWCYANKSLAEYALAAWDGEGDAPVGWHRHPPSARRRENGDPDREYIES
jgi:hypothetical protein